MEILFETLLKNPQVAACVLLIELVVLFMTSLFFSGSALVAAFPAVIFIGAACFLALAALNTAIFLTLFSWLFTGKGME